jgi:hypothetical protein
MGFEDHQRGVQDGYSRLPTAPPRNAAEAWGRAEGQNQRLADDARRQQQESSGHESLHLPLRYVPLGIGALVAWFLGVRLVVLLLLAGGLLGLAATPRLRWLLRQATPIYMGAMLGVCMSAVSLMFGGGALVADNLVIFPSLGAAAGAVFVAVRLLLRLMRR